MTDPDLVLMDLRMPGGDGVAAIRELRAENRERPRILVLTTYDTDRDIYAAIDAGADGYLLKVTSRDELVDAVLRAAAGQSVLAPSAAQSLVDRTRGEQLTERELQVLSAIAHGGTNRDVARELLVSEATVKTHLLRLYPKLGVRDRAAGCPGRLRTWAARLSLTARPTQRRGWRRWSPVDATPSRRESRPPRSRSLRPARPSCAGWPAG